MNLIEKTKALDTPDQYAVATKLLREMYSQSLAYTAKYLLNYAEINDRTHYEPIQALESPTQNKLLILPRGTFKSSIGSVSYPIWRLIRNPNERILLDGELYTNSKNFLREIRLHMESTRMIQVFGQWENEACWNEGELVIKQRTKILKEASITAGGIGSEKTGQHYDCIIMDDLNSPSNSSTEEGREKVIQHFKYNISILEPRGTLVVIATRYAEMDLPGWLLHNVIEPEEEKEHVTTGKGLLNENIERPAQAQKADETDW